MRIRSEEEAWEYLLSAWRDPAFGAGELVIFEDWPKLSVTYKPGDGSGGRELTRAEALMQRHFDLIFLLAKNGDLQGKLTPAERSAVNIRHSIHQGSTISVKDMVEALNAVKNILPHTYSPRARSLIAVGLALAYVGSPNFTAYMDYRATVDSSQHAADAAVKIAQVQADATVRTAEVQQASLRLEAEAKKSDERQIVFANLARHDTSHVVAFAASDFVPWRPALLDVAPYAGSMQWNSTQSVPAVVAKAAAKTARAEALQLKQRARSRGTPALIETPWMTEVLRVHGAPGAAKLGFSDA